MRRAACGIVILLVVAFTSSVVQSQENSFSVPNLISYSGTLKNVRGPALSSRTIGITFLIYKQQEGGAPLWLETQNVSVDGSGHYSVSLGSTKSEGIPADLFSPQEERWLAVQPQGQAELPRVLLVSVPYAFKAHEAETLGGLPASAFVMQASQQASSSAVSTAVATQSSASQMANSSSGAKTLGHGTQGYIAMWQNSVYLRNSALFQDLSQNVGIGTTKPGATLDVNGGVNAAAAYQIGGTSVLSIGTPLYQNLFLGLGAGVSNTTGPYNTFVGFGAGARNTTGRANIFIGYNAGGSNTTGFGNIFSGYDAGISNTTGADNTVSGYIAGLFNTTGCCNNFYGTAAGEYNTTGSSNNFSGYEAGESNTTGSNNTFLGAAAGFNNTTGHDNTYLGNNSGFNNTTGTSDIYIANQGPGSGTESNAIRIGTQGTGNGQQNVTYIAGIYGNAPGGALPVVVNANGQLGTATAGIGVTSFNSRTGAVVPAANDYGFSQLSGTLGSSQLSGTYSNPVTLSNTSNVYYGNGSNLTGVVAGSGSPYYIQNGTSQQSSANFNISGMGSADSFNSVTTYGIGGSAVVNIGSGADYNLFLGVGAGANNVAGTGIVNTFSGYGAGVSNTTGAGNTFSGGFAGYLNTTGLHNTFSGAQAGAGNTTGSYDTFSGFSAGASNTTGSWNTFYGVQAGASNTTGSYNTFSGFYAGLSNTTGGDNTFVGVSAGAHNTTGSDNTFIGNIVGANNTIGLQNAFSGAGAGWSNTTGSDNSFTGYGAGYYNTTGNYNSFVGAFAGNNSTTGSSNIYIANLGCGAYPCSENNTIRLGTQGTGNGQQNVTYIAGIYGSSVGGTGIGVYVDSNGQLGTTVSSRRFKEQIRDMGDSTNGLMKLRPVTFLYKPEYDKGPRTLQYGLIAEEVAEVYPDLVAYEPDGKPYTVKYQYLTTMLLNEMQKQYHRAEAQAEVIKTQQQEIDGLRQQLRVQNATMQERMSRLESMVERQTAVNLPQQ